MRLQEAWPACPACNEEMTFFAQLDSPSPDFPLADCGLIHTYVCFDCFEAEARIVSF